MQLNSKKICFCASTSEIKKALTFAVDTGHLKNTICPSKAVYLRNNLFPKLEEITEDKIIKLDDEYKPEATTDPAFSKLIAWLNGESIFKCGGGDNCKCGQNMTNKKFLSNIFRQLGLKNPNTLEIGK